MNTKYFSKLKWAVPLLALAVALPITTMASSTVIPVPCSLFQLAQIPGYYYRDNSSSAQYQVPGYQGNIAPGTSGFLPFFSSLELRLDGSVDFPYTGQLVGLNGGVSSNPNGVWSCLRGDPGKILVTLVFQDQFGASAGALFPVFAIRSTAVYQLGALNSLWHVSTLTRVTGISLVIPNYEDPYNPSSPGVAQLSAGAIIPFKRVEQGFQNDLNQTGLTTCSSLSLAGCGLDPNNVLP